MNSQFLDFLMYREVFSYKNTKKYENFRKSYDFVKKQENFYFFKNL
jgi:uncharacterized protein YfkK (UPF0435 family)